MSARSTAKISFKPVPELRLGLPKELKVTNLAPIPLKVQDFKLSWWDYFKKNEEDLYSSLSSSRYKDEFVLCDRRIPKDRKSWTLDDTVKDYYDSFVKNQQLYLANLTINRSGLKRGPKPKTSKANKLGSDTSPSGSGNASVVGASNDRDARFSPESLNTSVASSSSAGQKRKISFTSGSPSPPKQPIRQAFVQDWGFPDPSVASSYLFPNVNIPIADDDANSMADTVASQDSQDSQYLDLLAKGTSVVHVKSEVLQRIQNNINNQSLALVQNELQKLMDNGRWWRVVPRMPMSMNLLMMMFGLTFNGVKQH